MKTTFAASALAGVLALPGVACDVKVSEQGGIDLGISQGRASDTWTRTYSIPKGGLLEISNPLGRIEAEPAAGDQVEVVAEREVQARNDELAQAGLKALTMLEAVEPDSVRVEAKVEYPPGQSFRVGATVRYHVRVPAGVRVSFRNDTGETILRGLTSGVTASATNGPIRGRGLSGPIDAATVNGPVELEFTTVNADVKAHAINGGVAVRLPDNVNATIEGRAVNGGVRIDDRFKLASAERERTRVRGTLNAGGPTISMQVTNGGVAVLPLRDGGDGRSVEPGAELRER
jgi:hypothetical protein